VTREATSPGVLGSGSVLYICSLAVSVFGGAGAVAPAGTVHSPVAGATLIGEACSRCHIQHIIRLRQVVPYITTDIVTRSGSINEPTAQGRREFLGVVKASVFATRTARPRGAVHFPTQPSLVYLECTTHLSFYNSVLWYGRYSTSP
jgi:hypothetical protein